MKDFMVGHELKFAGQKPGTQYSYKHSTLGEGLCYILKFANGVVFSPLLFVAVPISGFEIFLDALLSISLVSNTWSCLTNVRRARP